MDGGGDLSFPKIEGKSDEYAILSGLFNDVDGKVDEQTKMQYYKTLIPYVYKNGDISKTEYDAMIEEVIVNKAKGGIANLKNGGRPGYMFGEGPVMDETVKLMVGVKEDNDTDGTVNVDDAVLMAYSAGDPLMNVDKMSRKTLIKHLNQMELPETDASEFDDDNIRQILIDFAPDMYTGTKYAKGGRVKRAAGGVMDLGGMEKDYRFNGGFVPLGEYEKKDDVPARLSKNEFVFTADAVRAAGGGSINKGAQKMYDTMKTLEAQPTAKRMTA